MGASGWKQEPFAPSVGAAALAERTKTRVVSCPDSERCSCTCHGAVPRWVTGTWDRGKRFHPAAGTPLPPTLLQGWGMFGASRGCQVPTRAQLQFGAPCVAALLFLSSWLVKPAVGNYFNLCYWAGTQLLLELRIYTNTEKKKIKREKERKKRRKPSSP